MRHLRRAWSRWCALFVGRAGDEERLAIELASHVEMQTEENLRAGMSPVEARRAALLKVGSRAQIHERYRDQRGLPAIEHLWRDSRHAVRQLVRTPVFSLTSTVTLTLCLAANALLFAIVDQVLLRPLPFPDADRLVLMSNAYPGANGQAQTSSGIVDYFDRLRETDVFDAQALINWSPFALTESAEPKNLLGMLVTPSFFRVLRTNAAVGRTFSEDEGALGHDHVIVLSDALWRSTYGADPHIIGRTVRLDNEPYTVVGIMPPTFWFNDDVRPVELWKPLAFKPEEKADSNRHTNGFWNLARLKPEETLTHAQAEIDALNGRNLERFPQYKQVLINAGFHTVVEPLQDRLVRGVRGPLILLWTGAVFVLLIGALNIANLLVVRVRAKAGEIATRVAIGANRWHLARQFVIEGLVLTLASSVLSLVVAGLGLRAFAALAVQTVPRQAHLQLTAETVIATIATAALAGVVLGLLPVAFSGSMRLRNGLTGDRGHTSAVRIFRGALAVAQVAFACILVIGAALLLASFRRAAAADRGFVADHVVTVAVALPTWRYPAPRTAARFAADAVAAIRQLPGVSAAGATDILPLVGNRSDSVILPEGYRLQPRESLLSPYRIRVTPGYFEAMGIHLIAGRWFDEHDGADATHVVIIDQTLARRFWPNENPVGHRVYRPATADDLFKITPQTEFLTVVGIANDVLLGDVAEPQGTGMYYLPLAQRPSPGLWFAVKTATPDATLAAVRSAIHNLDAELPIANVRTMDDYIDRSLTNRRLSSSLAIGFGALALLLATIGIYGVLAYLVVQRTREIGIRVALGSSAQRIMALVLREGAAVVLIGVTVGLVVATTLRQVIESQLYGIRATDAVVLGSAILTLCIVALAACLMPAWRAVQINPIVALRTE